LAVAAQEYGDVQAVEKGGQMSRSQAARNVTALAPTHQPDLLVSAAKAFARREAVKDAPDLASQPTRWSPDPLVQAAKAMATRQGESEIAGRKRLAEQAETEFLHLRQQVQRELEQLVRQNPTLRSKQGSGFIRLAVRREDLAPLSKDSSPTGRVLVACMTPQQRVALADRISGRKPVFITAVPITALSEICGAATDPAQIRKWLITIDKALSRTDDYLRERQRQAEAVRRTPGSDRGME
jgi:hypothetical protein